MLVLCMYVAMYAWSTTSMSFLRFCMELRESIVKLYFEKHAKIGVMLTKQYY